MSKKQNEEQKQLAGDQVPRVMPTAEERQAVEALFAQKKQRAPSPYMKVQNNGTVREISVDHTDPSTGHLLLMRSLGTTEADFANGLLTQLAALSGQTGQSEEAGLNFMLSVVKSVEPKDEIEALLAAQMAAVHVAVLTFARRLGGVDTIQQQDSAEKALNKLARTFTTQVEALKRYRTGGEQKVTVEHVHVHEGGQAIVGNIECGEGVPKKERFNPMRGDGSGGSRKCDAKTRRGTRCRSASMENGRCRMHGGTSTGAPKGNRNAWKHGKYSKETVQARRLVQALAHIAKAGLPEG